MPDPLVIESLAGQACSDDDRYAAFVTIGVDGYAPINDAFGHAAAGLLLERVADALQRLPTRLQTCGRIGVDAFGMLLENRWESEHEGRAACATLADEVNFALRTMLPLDGGIEIRVVTSCGYIVLAPNSDMSSEEIVTSAEIARKQVVQEGVTPRIREFVPRMVQEIQDRLSVVSGLRKGLREGELELYVQPVMDGNREVVSCEGLLRWNSPKRGIVPPEEFIALTEQTGLIIEIGDWVLDEACRVLSGWSQHDATREIQMSINVSSRQLEYDGFARSVLDALSRHGVAPARLLLEITEGTLHRDTERMVAVLSELKAHGVCTSLDDFGTGYSSLSYIQRLPVCQVKIDRSFVHTVQAGATDFEIVKMIVKLSRACGLQVVAEGVETEEQFEALAGLGIDRYQGWLFGKAVPSAQLTAQLR